jgi:uncharacterized membrane protein YeiB
VERVAGVDAARGLAVLGMFAAHVGYAEPSFWTPTGWLAAADGRSAALFATLAGVSLGLMTGGTRPVAGAARRAARRAARWRLSARAAAIAVIGYLLVALGTPIAVILPAYAVTFVVLLPVIGAPARLLVPLAAAAAVGGPLLVAATGGKTGAGTDPRSLLLSGFYPVAVWAAYVLAGLAVGRLPLTERAVQLRLLGAGAGLAAIGYGAAALGVRVLDGPARFLSAAPHADTTTEVTGNLGVALAVLAACLLLIPGTTAGGVLEPLVATGATALTAYVVHIVAIAVLGPEVVLAQRTNGTLLGFVVVAVVACTLWRRRWGRGPLERVVRAASLLAAAAALGAPSGRDGAVRPAAPAGPP